MEVAGLAFSVYRDVYFLAKSIYKLATSAQHFQVEQLSLLRSFYRQFLYLRTFHHLFFIVRGKVLVNESDLNISLVTEVCHIIQELGKAFSDYKDIAIEQDADYRRYCSANQQQNTSLHEFPTALNDMLSPLQLESQPPKSRTPLLFYNGLKDHFKRESIYKLAAWKWALFGRKRLGRALADLQHCNEQLKTFEPLFLFSSLVTRQDIANMVSAIQSEPHSDTSAFIPHIRVRELTEHGEDALIQQPTIAQPYVASDISREASLLQSTRIVVEYKYYSTAIDSEERSGPALGASSDICDEGMSQKCWPITQIHQLARLLSEAGSHELHTLPFKGYMNESPESRFAFYFDYPKHASDREPVSLNSLITNLEFGKRLSLPVRFQIAHKIAKALGAFHADGWVHKSINSDSIKFFYNRDGQCLYDRPYLVNFEFSRPETGETQNTFDDDFVKNLYRHPDRQGPPTTQFNKMHDVYALGIVLLEIGVWKSALSIYNGVMATRGSNSVLHPKELQMVFQEYASDCLSHSMGPAYAEAVMTCLSGKLMSFVGQHEFGIMFQKEAIRKIDARQILGITEDL